MKLLAVIFIGILPLLEMDITERLGVRGPLEFNKTEFKIAWTDKPNDGYYIQEYLPSGNKLESFDQMITIHLFITDMEVEDAVKQN